MTVVSQVMQRRSRLIGLSGLAFLLTCVAVPAMSAQSADCDRACLTRHIDAYYAALVANNPAGLPQAANARITENGLEAKLADTFWDSADKVTWRFDIANPRRGDTGTQVVVTNADGSMTMQLLRMKVVNGAITEMEVLRANKGDASGLWGPEQLTSVSPRLTLSIRQQNRDSYYDLIAAADSYWRAFQTNGTPEYRRARLMPDAERFENGLQTTGNIRNGVFQDTARGFDEGGFRNRNLWDRRYAVVDEERGIVLCMVRFGMKGGTKGLEGSVVRADRLVGEFFAVQNGYISHVQAVLVDRPDSHPTGWTTTDNTPTAGSNDFF